MTVAKFLDLIHRACITSQTGHKMRHHVHRIALLSKLTVSFLFSHHVQHVPKQLELMDSKTDASVLLVYIGVK